MEYREFENLGISSSLLGFGCMRFPTLKNGEINEAESEKMIDRAISAGVTYLDTAYPYHGGKSESFVGKAIKKYDRNKLLLATKLPVWHINEAKDVDKYFSEQLERLQTEYIDFYLLHALNKNQWDKMKKLEVVPELERLRKEGKIKYLGFSFHDSYEVFEEIIGYRQWDFCQIQLNYMDTEIQAGLKGYQLASDKKIPVIVMEPIKGGSLTTFSDDIASIFKAERPEASIASWALRYVGTLPNVKVILSGMSDIEQVEDNLKTFDTFEPLSESEQKVVEDVVAAVRAKIRTGCTGCRYCMPCPFGVDIPRCFSIWNEYAMYANRGSANWHYFHELEQDKRADICKQCGKCETMCPQGISIRENLGKMTQEMEEIKW